MVLLYSVCEKGFEKTPTIGAGERRVFCATGGKKFRGKKQEPQTFRDGGEATKHKSAQGRRANRACYA